MPDTPVPRKFKVKGFTSLLLTFAFLVMGCSGIVLYLTPKGRVAHWTGWTLLGLEKEQWAGIHMNICLLFLIVAGLHLYLNWGIFWGYLKKKAVAGLHLKWELAAALLIAVVVVAGTLTDTPPFSSIVELNDQIKVYWARQAARAPVPHAEELSLEEFATHINLTVDDVAEALRQEGFSVDNVQVTIRELAAQKGVAPSDVHAAILKHFPEAGSRRGRGLGRRQGRGAGQRQGSRIE